MRFTLHETTVILDALRADIGHRHIDDPVRDELAALIERFIKSNQARAREEVRQYVQRNYNK